MLEQPPFEKKSDPEFEKAISSLNRAEAQAEDEKSDAALHSLMMEFEERAKNDPDFRKKLEERLKNLEDA